MHGSHVGSTQAGRTFRTSQVSTDYVSVVSSAESFVDATSDVDVAVLLVDEYNTQLSEFATATALLIAKIPAA